MSDILVMWTIYDHPKDHPEHFVARKWLITRDGAKPSDLILKTETLGKLRRQMMELGLTCLTRNEEDDETIVEIWL